MSLIGYRASNHPQQVAKRDVNDEVDDRATTRELFDPLHVRFGFTVDVAAAPHNAKCDRFYDRVSDGLRQSWAGETVWCNPPYSDIGPWVAKAWDEYPWIGGGCRHAAPEQPRRAVVVAGDGRAPSRSPRHAAADRVPSRPAQVHQARAERGRTERASTVRPGAPHLVPTPPRVVAVTEPTLALGGGLVTSPSRITAAELARIRDQHPDIEQDTLPHIPPHEGDTNEEDETP